MLGDVPSFLVLPHYGKTASEQFPGWILRVGFGEGRTNVIHPALPSNGLNGKLEQAMATSESHSSELNCLIHDLVPHLICTCGESHNLRNIAEAGWSCSHVADVLQHFFDSWCWEPTQG